MSDSYSTALRRSLDLEVRIASHPEQFRVLTGDRPTGALHLGHLFGTLQNRVTLQQSGIEVMLVVADYQVITDRDSVIGIAQNVREVVLDNLAAGIDPTTVIFTHSAVPELNQLMLPFLSLVSAAELHRNPTVKDESASAAISGLMLTYPVHQAADILFCKANLVPVGKDQLPHVEMTRTIARRFNERYGRVFPEPDTLLSDAPNLLGTDGRKMSKSAGNAIELRASEDETSRLIHSAKTDARRDITYQPADRPEVSNLVLTAALCQGRDPEKVAEEIGSRGSGALKDVVTESINEFLRPLRARRKELARHPDVVEDILAAGNAAANDHAHTTMTEVRRRMNMLS